jgi:tetratricopeptide (TPR) repeat protein
MARYCRNIGLVLGLCAYALIGAERAHAQGNAADKAAAEALFDRGLALMREGKFQEACERLEQSQAIERGIGTMLYLAECYEKTGKTASAWALFREAASWAQAAGQNERADAGRSRAARLEKGLSRLTIQVAAVSRVAGLELKDNGAPVHPSVWGVSVPVDPGMHHIEAKAPGYRVWSGDVKVDDNGGSAEVGVPALEQLPESELAEAAASDKPSTAPAPAPVEERRLSKLQIAAIAIGGTGVVSLALGIGMGVRAVNKNDAAAELCTEGITQDARCGHEEGVDLSGQAVTAAHASTALYALGGALVAGGLLTFFLAPKERRVALAPRVDRASAGLQVGGVF